MHTPTPHTPQRSRTRRAGAVRALVALAILATAILTLAPSASAAPFDEIELVELDDIIDPDVPIDLDILDDIVIPLPQVTADAEVDCADGTIDVEIGNPTAAFVVLEVWVGDELAANPVVGPGLAWVDSFAAEENTSVDVRVEGTSTILDVELDVDCLSADPWFEFIPNCAVGQAWVELGNHGPDVAMMGVHYEDLPFAPGLVLPGTSSVQPLAVAPNTFVPFSIEADGVAIHTEGWFFDCPAPEPEPTPVPAEPTPEPADPIDVEQPAGGHGAEGLADLDDVDADQDATTAGDEIEGTETDHDETEPVDVVTGADEVAMAAGLETDSGSSTLSLFLVLLFTAGVMLMVGSVAAMKLRR